MMRIRGKRILITIIFMVTLINIYGLQWRKNELNRNLKQDKSIQTIFPEEGKARPLTLHFIALNKLVQERDSQNKEFITPLDQNKVKSKSFVDYFFPISSSERRKFLTLSFLMFFTIFIYSVTRDTKDALIITNCGAESVTFLKVYGVVPAITLFMVYYSYMTNIYPTRTLFYIILVPYLVFYFIFGFILYPSRNYLHYLSFRSNHQGISYVLNLFRYWTFSLYFIVSELWASTGVPLLFWSCANEVYEFDQAKRIYPLLSFIGNFGPVFAGLTMSIVSNFVSKFTTDDEKAFETSLKILTLCITAAGGIVSFLHYKIRAITDKERANQSLSTLWTAPVEDPTITRQGSSQDAPKTPRLTLKDSILTLTSSEYLINIAIMVISYCLTFEFSELIWKAAVRSAFPQKNDYLKFMGNYGMFVGSAAFLMMFITTDFLTKFGWKTTALITPLIMTTFASIFFYCLLGKGIQSKSTLLIAVYAGLLNSVLAKATRYAAFDPIKEMAYIQLPSNIRLKGKAAIDVLGARIGKSGGALIQQLLVLWFGNLFNGAGIVAVLFYLTIAVWIKSVFTLAKHVDNQQKKIQNEKEKRRKEEQQQQQIN